MNKLAAKPKTVPLLHPSPDIKNRSKIQGSASPVKQVKLFLENAKQHQKENKGLQSSPAEEHVQKSTNEEILRRRINELEMENNEFINFMKDYQALAERNKILEEQMLLLLQELEQKAKEESPHTHQRLASKDQNHTTESSHDHSFHNGSTGFRHSPHSQQEIKIVNAFDSYDHQELLEQNQLLKVENQRIKDLVDNSIREAIANMQQKFMAYITSMEEKLAALAAVNQQVANFRDIQSSKSSNQSHQRLQWHTQNLTQRERSQSNQNSERSGFSLNPCKNLEAEGLQRDQNGLDSSKVDIKLSYLSDSNRSFGNTNRKQMNVTPNSLFKNVEFIDSELPAKTLFSENTVDLVFQQLSTLRMNLSSLFSMRVHGSSSPHLQQSEIHIQSQLRDILFTYFPSTKALHAEEESQSIRKKMTENGSQIAHPAPKRVQESSFSIKPPQASELYLQQSYYLSLEPQQYLEFEQSKRKLSEVILIVKTFNRDYRHLLSESSRDSLLLLESAKRDYA